MSDIPSDLYYTEEHEYLKATGEDGVYAIGVTDYAQGELGDIVGETMDSGVRLVVLKGHGVVSAGVNLADAFDRMELAELSAKTVLIAAG